MVIIADIVLIDYIIILKRQRLMCIKKKKMSKVKQDFISEISVKNEKKKKPCLLSYDVSFPLRNRLQNLNILPYANIYLAIFMIIW